jgi:hypothetical protein
VVAVVALKHQELETAVLEVLVAAVAISQALVVLAIHPQLRQAKVTMAGMSM